MKPWKDRDRWARESTIVPVFLLMIYGGGTVWLTLTLFKRGEVALYFQSGANILAYAWGVLASVFCIYMIWVIRKAKREVRESNAESARKSETYV